MERFKLTIQYPESSIKYPAPSVEYRVMFAFLSKYKIIIILVCLCVISLILSWLTVDFKGRKGSDNIPFKYQFSSAFVAPVYFCSSIISVSLNKVAYMGSIFTSIFHRPAEADQIEILKNDIQDLELQLYEEKEKNRRLQELYEVYTKLRKSNPSFRLTAASVIGVEPTEWFRYLIIDKGREDGIDVDMAVITKTVITTDVKLLTGAIVGRIESVYSHSARVQLITDRLSVVAVNIQPLGDLVLMRGQSETENCVIDEVPSTTQDMLKRGDVVIVDERSTIFPPGMLVGRVSDIKRGIEFCPIEVEPAFKFRNLREVIVVLGTGY